MTRRNVLTSLIEKQLAAANSVAPVEAPNNDRVLAGPVRAMSLTLDRISEESRALQQALAAGASVIELDPSLVDLAFIRDRLPYPDDPAFLSLKESLRDHGQEVPILVRPHPSRAGAYQAAYGHRRLKAAQELGLKIKAVVRSLDDRQLIVAQGVENSARRDLSFIERALYAKTLEDSGYDRELIMAALSTDKTELSKMISVVRDLPELVVRAIGPAPKAGRRRWLQLSQLLSSPDALRQVEEALNDASACIDSDARFLKALLAGMGKKTELSPVKNWKNPEGATLARITRDNKATVVRFDMKAEPDFGSYVVDRLSELYQEFRASRE